MRYAQIQYEARMTAPGSAERVATGWLGAPRDPVLLLDREDPASLPWPLARVVDAPQWGYGLYVRRDAGIPFYGPLYRLFWHGRRSLRLTRDRLRLTAQIWGLAERRTRP